ncbi:xacB [Symbiodinium pilosum]|uniref:XacB protein n=1 Tax=Symbiodinium pilosum TaxID=2952 RepID=A0A812J6Q2_SYMPI|nr:xacB [Symbiodinium pilosum]
MDWSRLKGLGGPASLKTSDPLALAGPDSFYAVSKICGEAMGYLYARVHRSFEFVALRIGWCLYDCPTDLAGNECEAYLRSTFLSKRDFRGFLRGALRCDLAKHRGFLVAYAVSRNGLRMFDLEDTVEALGYDPVDDAEDYYSSAPLRPLPRTRSGPPLLVMAAASVVVAALWRRYR